MMFTKLDKRMKYGLFLAVMLALVVTVVALASAIAVAIVDVTAPTGSVTIQAGQSAPIVINLTVTGNQDGTATFKVNRDWALSGGTFVGSNPETFTVPAGEYTAGSSWTESTTGTITVASGQAVGGPFTLQVSAFDITNSNQQGAKLGDGADSHYEVTVTAAPSDITKPVITPTITGTLGNNGWYTSDVKLTWSVVDLESTITSQSGCDEVNITSDQSETTYTCTATSAGGTETVSVKIKRDATKPVVSLVGGPADGASYYFGSVPAAPTCSASDATSGLAGACSVSGYDTTVGSHTVTASAADNAGNTNTSSATYTVLAWTLNGFHRPVDMGILNYSKAGSTVPLKFNVFAGSTELTDTSVVKYFTQKISCTSGEGDAIEEYATGNTSLRYDTTSGQFVFNWKTPNTKGICYRVTMETNDGTSIYADFQLK